MENALEIIKLNKIYRNNVQALDNINLTVKKGDLFAFLGPNGAGKSTVIGIISSLVRITSGRVNVLGKDITKEADYAKRNIGLVPQEYNLCQFIPIEETMINVAGYFGIDKKDAEKRTYTLFNQLGIWDKEKIITKRQTDCLFKNSLNNNDAERLYSGWKEAVKRSMNWINK